MQCSLTSRANIDSLTGLRFIAAMMVFFTHFGIPGLSGALSQITQSGYAGVTFFFVLSGFIITYNYLDQFEAGVTRGKVGNYLVARLARVYPLYFLSIMLGWWLLQGSGPLPWAHLLAVQTWNPDVEFAFKFNPPAWSIGVEVFLYLAFPILVPLAVRSGIFESLLSLQIAAALVSIVMLIAAIYFTLADQNALSSLSYMHPGSSHRWLYRMPAARLGDFLLGMFGAVYFMRFAKSDAVNVRRWGFATMFCMVTVVVFMGMRKNYLSAFSWDVAYAIPGVLLIIGLAINRQTLASRVLGSSTLILLGESSYALYLVHVPASLLRPTTSGGLAYEVALYSMFTLVVIALSIGIHVGIEKPARDRIRQWFSPHFAPVPIRSINDTEVHEY